MICYSEDPKWADVVPLPQDDGGTHPLAAIAYSADYVEAMSYMRAIMAQGEHTERVLELTKDVIEMNPAHYTVWLYRSRTIEALGGDRRAELGWLNETALANLKNYQIWHHRQSIVEALVAELGPTSAATEALLSDELDFIAAMFEKDAKNYHVWSYRQWLARHLRLWNSAKELDFVEAMLQRDVRNNSAWNHRWFVVFGQPDRPPTAADDVGTVDREVDYAKAKVRLAPQNLCPWNYLRGVLKVSGAPLRSLEAFVGEFASLKAPGDVCSSHALDLLADICRETGRGDDARAALELLAHRYDPIRSRYWSWRRDQLEQVVA